MNKTVSIKEFIELFDFAVEKHINTNDPIPKMSKHNLSKIDSCLASPFMTFDGKDLYPTIYDKASMLMYLIIKNHPLENGNKRMAAISTLFFLDKNGIELTLSNDDIYDLTKYVASSDANDKDEVLIHIKEKLTKTNNTMLKYEELLQEEVVNKADLPKEIKQKIQGLNLTISVATKDPKNQSKQDNVTRGDLEICDMIQNWIEKDLPAPPPPTPAETPAEKEARETAEAKAKEDNDKAKADSDKAAAEQETANKVTAMQNEIVTIMNASASRTIEKSQLTNILGRGPADKETIGTLKLSKMYLTTRYKAIV